MAFDFRALAESQGKALPNNRFFDGGSPLSTYIPGGSQERKPGALSQTEARRHLDAYGGGQAIDWVMDAISLYTSTAVSAKWHLEEKGETLALDEWDKTGDITKVADKALVNLLREPNPFMDYGELLELTIIDWMLVGNAYWLKWRNNDAGKPLAIYRMSPKDIKIIPGPQGPQAYEYQPDGVKEKLTLQPTDVIHFKRPNPHSPYYGLGLIKGGGRPFDLELALTDSTAAYFENRADPSLIVQSERRVPRDVFNKLRTQIRLRTSGPKRAGELLVLEAGLKAMTLTPNARDAMFAELSSMSMSRVLGMFHVHPALLGIPGHTSGQDKISDIRREFDNKTMRPFLDRIETLITRALVAAWDDYEFKIDYRYVMPQEDAVKLGGDFASVPGVKVAEVRQFFVDAGLLKEATTGDKDIDEMVLNLPGENAGDTGQAVDANGNPINTPAVADRPLPREAGRPPKGENTKAFPRGGAALPAGAKVRRPQGKALTDATDPFGWLARIEAAEGKALDNVRTTVGNKLPDEQRPNDVLADVRTRDIDAITAAFKRDLADAMHPVERNLLDHVEGKAFDAKTLADRMRNSEAWKMMQNLISDVMDKYVRQAVSSAQVQLADQGLTPAQPIDQEAIVREIIARENGARGITDTLKASILAKVEEAVKDGKSRTEVDTIVRDSIRTWKESQAETIAMTEAVHGYNEAALSTFEAAGIRQVFVSDGHDHDEPCQEADGQVWDIGFARENRLEHPRCRRAFVPVTL